MGVVLEENKNQQLYVAPGHNPKETPEMFVKKVQINQKRISKSIEIYEQKEKERLELESQKVDLSAAIRYSDKNINGDL